MKMLNRFAVVAALSAVVSSCDDEGLAPDTSIPEQCYFYGMELRATNAHVTPGGGFFEFTGQTTAFPPFDRIVVQSYQAPPYRGPSEPGIYDIQDVDYEDCGLCVLTYKNCMSENDCEAVFYARRGQVEFSSLEGSDGFSARLLDVELEESRVHAVTGNLVPRDGGVTWCGYDVPLHADLAAKECVAKGNGRELGDNIGDFTLKNCNGDDVSLHASCGDGEALWLTQTAGWCTACAAVVPQIWEYYTDNSGFGIDVGFVLGQDDFYDDPTPAFCNIYAEREGLDPAKVLIDPQFATINKHFVSQPYLPWFMILDTQNMEYVGGMTASGQDPGEIIQALVND